MVNDGQLYLVGVHNPNIYRDTAVVGTVTLTFAQLLGFWWLETQPTPI